MEKSLLEDMLELAKREKGRWEKRIKEINAELEKEGAKTSGINRKPKRRRSSKTFQAEKKIIEILENSEKLMRPKELADKLKEFQINVKPVMVRQILNRLKDKTFVSPEFGLWKLKKEEVKEKTEA